MQESTTTMYMRMKTLHIVNYTSLSVKPASNGVIITYYKAAFFLVHVYNTMRRHHDHTHTSNEMIVKNFSFSYDS